MRHQSVCGIWPSSCGYCVLCVVLCCRHAAAAVNVLWLMGVWCCWCCCVQVAAGWLLTPRGGAPGGLPPPPAQPRCRCRCSRVRWGGAGREQSRSQHQTNGQKQQSRTSMYRHIQGAASGTQLHPPRQEATAAAARLAGWLTPLCGLRPRGAWRAGWPGTCWLLRRRHAPQQWPTPAGTGQGGGGGGGGGGAGGLSCQQVAPHEHMQLHRGHSIAGGRAGAATLTTRDWPRRQSPAAKMPSMEVANSP